jgi:hypothetical protein
MPVGPPKVGAPGDHSAVDLAHDLHPTSIILLTKANPAKAGDAKLRD